MFLMRTMLEYYGIPLLITLIVEGFVIYVISKKQIKLTIIFLMVNLVTNPMMNWVLSFVNYPVQQKSLLLLELAVIVIESTVLLLFTKSLSKSIMYVLLANLLSYGIGMIIIPLMY